NRESARIGRSRFSTVPFFKLPRLVRSSVSRDISAVNIRLAIERTVRQTPLTAMLEPVQRSSNTVFPVTAIVRKLPVSSISTTSPTSSIIPVNICSQNDVRPRLRRYEVFQRNCFRQLLYALAANRRNLAST